MCRTRRLSARIRVRSPEADVARPVVLDGLSPGRPRLAQVVEHPRPQREQAGMGTSRIDAFLDVDSHAGGSPVW